MLTERTALSRPGILLDRDGTIIVDYHYVGHIERVQFIPGAIEAIRRFNQHKIPVAIVTNQSGVARGFYPEDNIRKVHNYIEHELQRHGAHVDLILYSPDHPDGFVTKYARDSDHHKPAPGMAIDAAHWLDLDLKQSWVVGDRPEDVIMAYHVGANAVYLGGDLDSWSQGGIMPYPFPSLAAAAGFIIERITGVSQDEFPNYKYTGPVRFWNSYRSEIERVSNEVNRVSIAEAADMLAFAYDSSFRVFVAGNGSAASLSDHFQCDHVKGIGSEDKFRPEVISLTSNSALMTAIANDIGYDAVFSYQLERQAMRHETFVAFSVSGNSANIVRALQWSSENGVRSIAVVACDGGKAAGMADVTVHIPTSNYGIAEDIMNSIMHSWAQYIRHSRMSEAEIKSARF